MKILFFVSSLNAGGAERVATTLANAWVRRGDDVVLAPTYLTKQDTFYPLDEAIALRWLADCRGHWWSRLLPPLEKWLRIRRLIQDSRPDVIVSFLTNVNVNVLIASAGIDVPIIVSERTHPAYSRSAGRLLRVLRRMTYGRARFVVMQTADGVAALQDRVPAARDVVAIPNPLPPELLESGGEVRGMLPTPGHQQGDESRRSLVAMGRLVPSKQFDHLIDVFGTLAERYPDWDLTLWGDGPLRATLDRKISAMGLRDRIRLAGRTASPWQALADGDIFVMTSRVEGFPNVLLEAMALGLPCVALDCPSGPAELSHDGRDARLVPLDDRDGLVGALDELMRNADLRESLGRRAAQSVRQRYGLASILARWDALFEKATEQS